MRKHDDKFTRYESASQLRERAEKLLQERADREVELQDAQTLAHELQIHQAELEMQNEELRKSQAELEESRSRYADLYDFAPVGYLTLDKKGRILEANLTACILLGIERAYIIGKPLASFSYGQSVNDLFNHLSSIIDGAEVGSLEVTLRTKTSDVYYAMLTSIPWNDSEGNRLCRSSIIDMTEKHNAAEALNNAFNERGVLIKEVHHRVKNNLAIIASLINLQSGQSDSDETKSILNKVKMRISSIALVHDMLYKSVNLARIKMKQYIKTLISNITILMASDKPVSCTYDIEDIELDMDTLIPLGLIINELITNSIKHSFDGIEKPQIVVTLSRGNDNNVCLSMSDNGNRLPEGFDIKQTSGLGLKLIAALTNQMHGVMQIYSENGKTFKFTFPDNGPIARAE